MLDVDGVAPGEPVSGERSVDGAGFIVARGCDNFSGLVRLPNIFLEFSHLIPNASRLYGPQIGRVVH